MKKQMKERTFKPAWRSFYRHIFFVVLCFALVLISSVHLPADYRLWLWGAFALALVCALCDMACKRNGTLLIVRPDEVAVELGIIGHRSVEVSMRDVRTIRIEQSVFQRMLNLGDIRVASSGTDGYEISARNMPDPQDIREMIQAYAARN